MNLKPLGDRVLIKPELPATTTESGILLAEHRKPEQTGTVVAVGPCPHPLKAEADAVLAYIDDEFGHGNVRDSGDEVRAMADLLRRAVQREPQVKAGDYVVFSWASGQEIWVEDGEERYLLMREADILCVVEGL